MDDTEILTARVADLIARVRHGDDCTANDLADRMVRGGLVQIVDMFRPKSGD